MPSGKSWFDFIFVNIIFLIGIMIIVMISFIAEIRRNWPIYRCNPLYMPLSKDMQADFTYCVQDMQKNMMGSYLQPFNYILDNVGTISNSFTDQLNSVREMFAYTRGNFGSGITDIFSTFQSIIIEFQKVMFGFKDVTGKIMGILVTFMHTLSAFFNTGMSFKDGPMGQLLMATGRASSCFHPETKLRLQSGKYISISDVQIGDVLINGSRVRATMKIENPGNETMYRFLSDTVSTSDKYIYVTGSHYIYSKNQNKFVRVDQHEDATKVEEDPKLEWFSCIITDDHKIPIGKYTFWDWEDHLLQ